MKSETIDYSYFAKQLFSYCQSEHPVLANNAKAINARGDLAAQAYETARNGGHTVNEAMEIANQTLFVGLHFSIYRTLLEVVDENFTLTEQQRKDLVMQILPKAEQLSANYQINDNFANTAEFNHFTTELIGLVDISRQQR